MTNVIGIILIIIGIVSLGYRGITYTKQEKVAEIGSLKITANEDKTITLPPLVGGLSLVAGIALVIIARAGRRD